MTNLQGVSEEELGRLFSQHGNLLTKKLLRDQGGKNKGIAFVRFSKKSEADTAIAHLHGHFFPGWDEILDLTPLYFSYQVQVGVLRLR